MDPYRLYKCPDGKVRPVQMNSIDELDYDKDKFVTDERYETEEEAIQAMAKIISAYCRLVY